MDLDHDKIAAFAQLSADGSFTKASRTLCLTQPALSKKIKRLEEELGATLVVRDRKGLALTEPGRELIRYARMRQTLDQELLQSIQSFNSGGKVGEVKIASYSSISRSAVLPCLQETLQGSQHIHVDFMSRELTELPDLLLSGRADVIITTMPVKRDNIAIDLVGKEEFVHVRPKTAGSSSSQVHLPYLDHDANDNITLQFLEKQGFAQHVARNFYDDIYTILDAVQRGLGQAVVSKHLLAETKDLTVVKHEKKMVHDIFVQYYRNTYQTKLQKAVLTAMRDNLPKYLRAKAHKRPL